MGKMIDVYDEVQRNRLFRAIEFSGRHLEPFRRLTVGLAEEYTGSGYGDAGTTRRDVLLNLQSQAVDAYHMALVANRPRVLVTAKQPDYEFFAKRYSLAINNLIEEIGLEYTLRKMVMDAFFCIGVVKIHMADSIPVLVEESVWMDPGIPFVSNVPLDNFVCDMLATEWHKVKFAGDTYRIPFEDLKAGPFNSDVVRLLVPTPRTSTTDTGRMEQISRGTETEADELMPMIDLMDVWLPRNGKIYTFAVQSRDKFQCKLLPPLAEMEWSGSETGPYPVLSFNDVPENLMPASPAAQLAPLARRINNILRKQGRRAQSQKVIHTYTPAGAESAQRLQNAGDDAWIQVADPKEVGEQKVGGVDPSSMAFCTELIELYDRMAGNLTAILGLGVQAETLGQEQLIHASASKKIAQMQYRVNDVTRQIVTEVGKLLWDDASITLPGRLPVEGTQDYSVDGTWKPQERQGDFSDYAIDIDVYSMSYQSPVQRLNSINYFFTQVYGQLAGVLPPGSLQELAEIYAELLNEPRIRKIAQLGGMMPAAEEGPSMPTSTSREYIRRSAGSLGGQSGAPTKQQAWLSQASQSSPTSGV